MVNIQVLGEMLPSFEANWLGYKLLTDDLYFYVTRFHYILLNEELSITERGQRLG